jgi:hypothetical protein
VCCVGGMSQGEALEHNSSHAQPSAWERLASIRRRTRVSCAWRFGQRNNEELRSGLGSRPQGSWGDISVVEFCLANDDASKISSAHIVRGDGSVLLLNVEECRERFRFTGVEGGGGACVAAPYWETETPTHPLATVSPYDYTQWSPPQLVLTFSSPAPADIYHAQMLQIETTWTPFNQKLWEEVHESEGRDTHCGLLMHFASTWSLSRCSDTTFYVDSATLPPPGHPMAFLVHVPACSASLVGVRLLSAVGSPVIPCREVDPFCSDGSTFVTDDVDDLIRVGKQWFELVFDSDVVFPYGPPAALICSRVSTDST